MIFCGQCGFQLPPGIARCPRCGTAVETNMTTGAGETHTDDPTIASPSLRTGQPSLPGTFPGQSSLPGMPPGQLSQHGTPFTPNNQQRLILRPGGGTPDYNTQQQAYDATSRVDAPNYPTNTPAYPNYGTQGGGNYPAQNVPPNHMTQSGGNYQTYNQSFAGIPQQGNYEAQQQAPRSSNRGRITGLVLILLGLIFILGGFVLFMVQHHNNSGSAGGTGSQPSPTQQAQAVVQQYYGDINKHDYTSAYALWKNNPQNLANFSQGFQNTLNDQLTINQVAQQADGTVKITVTVSATEKKASGGQQQSSYHGNYVLAQQTDSSWKIMSGTLAPA
jgi:ketosteroid isomerase-like protein